MPEATMRFRSPACLWTVHARNQSQSRQDQQLSGVAPRTVISRRESRTYAFESTGIPRGGTRLFRCSRFGTPVMIRKRAKWNFEAELNRK